MGALDANPADLLRFADAYSELATRAAQISPQAAQEVQRIADTYRPIRLDSGPTEGEVLVVGWGSTYGAIRTAALELQQEGYSVAHVHLRHMFPMNKGLRGLLKHYKKVLVPEMNTGQLRQLLRAEFLVDAQGLNKVQGMPFTSAEIREGVLNLLRS